MSTNHVSTGQGSEPDPVTTSAEVPAPLPAQLRRLVDDAAIFPPGDLPLAEAVAAHRRHREAPYADLVGPFVVDDRRLPTLAGLLGEASGEGLGEALHVAVVVTGGAGALEPALRWVMRSEMLRLSGLETALNDPDALAGNARRVVAALDAAEAGGAVLDDVAIYVELPPPAAGAGALSHGWLAALDELAMAGLSLKVRTGGATAEAFPSPAALAAVIGAALDREVSFKCTAGLHRAVRHREVGTGIAHHGFLNILLATRASLDGSDAAELTRVLDTGDPGVVADAVRAIGPAGLTGARRWFCSFGSCSVSEPLEDLAALGLYSP